MITLTADEAMQDLLGRLKEPTEIRDSKGRPIGYFTPAASQETLLYQQVAAHFDPEEMRRRKESGHPGDTTPEVLEHLKSLGTA